MISWPPYLVPIIKNNALHNLYFLVTLIATCQIYIIIKYSYLSDTFIIKNLNN